MPEEREDRRHVARAELLVLPADPAPGSPDPTSVVAAIERAHLTGPALVRRCGAHLVCVFPGRDELPNWRSLVRTAGPRLRLTEARWPLPTGWQLACDPDGLRVVPDQLAMRPIFVHHAADGDGLLSTRPEWLAAITGAALDPHAVLEQLGLSFMLGRRSPFVGIQRLEAGDAIRADGRRLRVDRLDLGLEPAWPVDDASSWWPGQLERIAVDAVAAVSAGGTLQLTGGHDSRLVLALCLSHGACPRAALTVGRPGDEDVEIAALVCRHLGIRHEVVAPDADPASVVEDAREHAADSGFAVNAVEFAWMRAALRRAAERLGDAARTAGGVPVRIGGLGGETAGGFYDTPFDAGAARLRTVRAAFVRRRVVLGASDLRALLDEASLPGALAVIEARTLRAIDRHEGGFRDRLDRFYVAERMRQWAGASLHASVRVIDGVEPLLAAGFRAWGRRERALGRDPRTSERSLIRHLAPDLAALPFTGVHPAADAGRAGDRLAAGLHRARRTGERTWRRLRGGPGRPQLGAETASGLLLDDPSVRSALHEVVDELPLPWAGHAPGTIAGVLDRRPRALGVLLTTAWARQEARMLARDLRRSVPSSVSPRGEGGARDERGSMAA